MNVYQSFIPLTSLGSRFHYAKLRQTTKPQKSKCGFKTVCTSYLGAIEKPQSTKATACTS